MKTRIKKITLLGVSFIWILSGCETTGHDQYYWGSYENLLYTMYLEPGKAPPSLQISKLEKDIQKATSRGKVVPPGVYAHLGLMYAANGNIASSVEAFNTEKTLYPESQVLIDGMLKRAALHAK